MKRFALTSLAMAFALTVQVQAEEQVPPPPAGPYQSFALMPDSPEAGPQSVHFPPMNYKPESFAAPDMPPQAPAWALERPEPPARPEWAGEMPKPAEMGQPPEMPEPPAWVQERPEPPARPEWAQQRPCPGYQAGSVEQQPCRGFPPDRRQQRQRMPESPAWVQQRQQWQEMRGQEFSPPPPRFQRPPAPPSWGQPYRAERNFPPAGYERRLMPPPPSRFPSEPFGAPYAPGYYPK